MSVSELKRVCEDDSDNKTEFNPRGKRKKLDDKIINNFDSIFGKPEHSSIDFLNEKGGWYGL